MGYTDGVAGTGNTSISYVYHKHTGSSSSGGGCYSTPIYHKHTSSCYKTVSAGCSGWTKWSGSDGWQKCPVCGWTTYAPDESGGVLCGSTKQVLNCNKSITGYKLGCGKTTNSIESATIIFK